MSTTTTTTTDPVAYVDYLNTSRITRDALQNILGFRPKNMMVYYEAFIHKSVFAFVNSVVGQHPIVAELPPIYTERNLERLEFLGDAVMQKSITKWLFTYFTNATEGQLSTYRSNIVRKETIAAIAQSLKLDQWIQMSPSARSIFEQKGNLSIMEDVYEALIGAIELDRGEKYVDIFVYHNLRNCLSLDDITRNRNYKMQVIQTQQQTKLQPPEFITLDYEGPTNDRVFTLLMRINDTDVGPVTCRRLIDGEQELCKMALDASLVGIADG